MQRRFGILALVALAAVGAIFVLSRPVATHSVDIDLLAGARTVDAVKNMIEITRQNEILWNGHPVSLAELDVNLQQTLTLPVEPELQFEPEPDASYELSAKVLNTIKASKVTKFGFVGNEKYAAPDESGSSVDMPDDGN